MAIFHDARRKGRTTFDDAMRSTDGALNALVAVLLIALAFGPGIIRAGFFRPPITPTLRRSPRP